MNEEFLPSDTIESFSEKMRQTLNNILAGNNFNAKAEDVIDLRNRTYEEMLQNQQNSLDEQDYDETYSDEDTEDNYSEEYAYGGPKTYFADAGVVGPTFNYDLANQQLGANKSMDHSLSSSLSNLGSALSKAKTRKRFVYDAALRDRSFKNGFGLFNQPDQNKINELQNSLAGAQKIIGYNNGTYTPVDDDEQAYLENMELYDANGQQQNFAYDMLGNVRQISGPKGTMTDNVYNKMIARRRKLGGSSSENISLTKFANAGEYYNQYDSFVKSLKDRGASDEEIKTIMEDPGSFKGLSLQKKFYLEGNADWRKFRESLNNNGERYGFKNGQLVKFSGASDNTGVAIGRPSEQQAGWGVRTSPKQQYYQKVLQAPELNKKTGKYTVQPVSAPQVTTTKTKVTNVPTSKEETTQSSQSSGSGTQSKVSDPVEPSSDEVTDDTQNTGSSESGTRSLGPQYGMTSFQRGPFGSVKANFGFMNPYATQVGPQSIPSNRFERKMNEVYAKAGNMNPDYQDAIRNKWLHENQYMDTRDKSAWQERNSQLKKEEWLKSQGLDGEDYTDEQRDSAWKKENDTNYYNAQRDQESLWAGQKKGIERQEWKTMRGNKFSGMFNKGMRSGTPYSSQITAYDTPVRSEVMNEEVTEPQTETTEPQTEITEPQTENGEPKTEVTEPQSEKKSKGGLSRAAFGQAFRNGWNNYITHNFQANQDGTSLDNGTVNIGQERTGLEGDTWANLGMGAMMLGSNFADRANNYVDLEGMTSADQVVVDSDTDRGWNTFDTAQVAAQSDPYRQGANVQFMAKYGRQFNTKVRRLGRFVHGGVYNGLTQEEAKYILSHGGTIKILEDEE